MKSELGSTGDPAGATQSPFFLDFEQIDQAVEVVDEGLDLVQTHVVDKLSVRDFEDDGWVNPKDGRRWNLDLKSISPTGRLYLFELSTPEDSDHHESFLIGNRNRISERPSLLPFFTTEHQDSQRDESDEEAPLQIAKEAVVILRGIFGIKPEEPQSQIEQ